jgi:hypothetical protein
MLNTPPGMNCICSSTASSTMGANGERLLDIMISEKTMTTSQRAYRTDPASPFLSSACTRAGRDGPGRETEEGTHCTAGR